MADAVTRWNDVLIKVIKQVGGPPGPIARGGAMMHAAVYDAAMSIVPTHEPYLVRVPATESASLDAAIAHAAHDTLAAAFPDTAIDLTAERDKELALLPPGTSATQIAAGAAVGRAAARAMIEARRHDGADHQQYHVPGSQPGDWRPTDSTRAAATPQWPAVTPFCMASGAQFRPPRPGGYLNKRQMLRSPEYAAQYDEVKELGGADSTARTEEQTQIALFWANDVDGTYKPPGQLFALTHAVSADRGLDVLENARLFALVGLALADAGVVAWDAKYATDLDLWRPQTAIALADDPVDGDDNPDTEADSDWLPLLQDGEEHFSPPFPAYVSGHATFAAAHAAVMRRYFGTDNVCFDAVTDDPEVPAGTTRRFSSFTEAARENARSRVYLGVHFQWDGDHGFLSGTALGEHVVDTRLRPM
ncbi:hypothetical protein GCM10023328_40600 [Modestobacter marinus]|uniref:Phosphatidic acid phosphatase type 2/haloperoxidase domain-containing protein n=1 Tax=Modestobacter marinus TaxID=477641 RepID=A0A846LME4_9ACTN|nr:vanadium-dependent haloperoxidase [Modestobacter marinus]NIH68637.1 hypothetical protein [Modestobacter marinus]GGL58901.1 hypothetical protein GCM10011589_13590 [Modestobacter marinus]